MASPPSEQSSQDTRQSISDKTGDRTWQRFGARQLASRWGVYLIAGALIVGSYIQLEFSYRFVPTAGEALADLLSRMYPPNFSYYSEVQGPAIESIQMAFVATVLSMFISLPIAFLAAENTTANRLTYWLGKVTISVNRSVNTIIYAIIFVIILGPGALSGVAAMMVASVGSTAKLLAEEMEEINHETVDAIRATGGSRWAEITFGIFPQIKVFFITISTFEWDKNVRGSTVLGFVGAGGIGQPLFDAVNTFQYQSAMVAVVVILLLVLFSEGISAYTRSKVR